MDLEGFLERFEGSTLHGSDAAHEAAYLEALDEYERTSGRAADASWRALLYIGTADLALWAWMHPRLDYRADKADLRTDTRPVGNKYLWDLLDLARHLHDPTQYRAIYLAGMLQSLPERYYRVVMWALREYRGSL